MVTFMKELVLDMKSVSEPLRNEKYCISVGHLCIRRDLLILWKVSKHNLGCLMIVHQTNRKDVVFLFLS